MTSKKFPLLRKAVSSSKDWCDCEDCDIENAKVELALSKAEKKSYEAGRKNGRQDQLIIITNLFNDLRNKRFQFNDEVKMVIDMLKDEITKVNK